MAPLSLITPIEPGRSTRPESLSRAAAALTQAVYTNAASRLVYGLVGLAAVYAIASLLASRSADPAGHPATSTR